MQNCLSLQSNAHSVLNDYFGSRDSSLFSVLVRASQAYGCFER